MNSALGIHGAAHTFDAIGQTWSVFPPTQKVFADYEMWLENRERAKLSQQKAFLPPDEYESERERFYKRVADGEFDRQSEYTKAAMRTIAGSIMYAYFVLRQAHKDITPDEVQRIMLDNAEDFAVAMNSCHEDLLKNVRATKEAEH